MSLFAKLGTLTRCTIRGVTGVVQWAGLQNMWWKPATAGWSASMIHQAPWSSTAHAFAHHQFSHITNFFLETRPSSKLTAKGPPRWASHSNFPQPLKSYRLPSMFIAHPANAQQLPPAPPNHFSPQRHTVAFHQFSHVANFWKRGRQASFCLEWVTPRRSSKVEPHFPAPQDLQSGPSPIPCSSSPAPYTVGQ